MITLHLTPDQVRDLVQVLGAAKPLFEEQAKQQPKIFAALLTQYAEAGIVLQQEITRQHNEQVS